MLKRQLCLGYAIMEGSPVCRCMVYSVNGSLYNVPLILGWRQAVKVGLTRYCMLREKGKTFLVQFAGPNDSIWDHKIL